MIKTMTTISSLKLPADVAARQLVRQHLASVVPRYKVWTVMMPNLILLTIYFSTGEYSNHSRVPNPASVSPTNSCSSKYPAGSQHKRAPLHHHGSRGDGSISSHDSRTRTVPLFVRNWQQFLHLYHGISRAAITHLAESFERISTSTAAPGTSSAANIGQSKALHNYGIAPLQELGLDGDQAWCILEWALGNKGKGGAESELGTGMVREESEGYVQVPPY